MNSQELKKIVNFLNGKTLNDINKVIKECEDLVNANIERVKRFADGKGITITIQEKHDLSSFIDQRIGIAYITPAYVEEFKAYTCRFSALFLLWYKVRDSISDYYAYLNAEVNGDKCKMSTIRDYDSEGLEVIRSYQNGKSVYILNDELKTRISLVSWIHSYFNKS